MAASSNPWHLFTPLSGDNALDRALIEATRGEEIQVLTNLIAASRVSLLYSASGNGKSSLINAGIVPFFNSQGYAVFRTRPRPPWSTQSPVQAFKESILRNPSLPDLSQAQVDLLENARLELAALPEGAAPSAQRLFEVIQGPAARWLGDGAGRESFIVALKEFVGNPIPLFLKRTQELLGPKSRLLILCDQFEELFVHFANTPVLDDFVTQCGQAWADSGLRIHLVFSLREDWVGSMIEFRQSLPDVFRNFYQLKPVRTRAARRAILLPLEKSGLTVSEDFVQRLLGDLALAYSVKQSRHLHDAPLPVSPDQDPYIELPALQVVCDKLWQTRHRHDPFTVAHYESLKKKEHDPGAAENTPTGAVLDGYIQDYLRLAEPGQSEVPPSIRELRLDCLYLMTDRTAHRRALLRDRLLQDLRLLRPAELYPDPVTEEELEIALKPLVEGRLVRQDDSVYGQKQYELAHDFAVQSVLRAWAEVDRQRTVQLAAAHRRHEAMARKFTELAKTEEYMFQFLRIGPAIGLIALLVVIAYGWFFSLISYRETDRLSEYLTASSFLIPLKWIAIVSFGAVSVTAIFKRYAVGAIYGGLTMLACWLTLARLLPDPTTTQIMLQNSQSLASPDLRGPVPLHFGSFDLGIFIGIYLLSAFVYPRIILEMSRRLEGSPLTQRISLVVWNEIVNAVLLGGTFAIGFAVGFGPIPWPRPEETGAVLGPGLGILLYVLISSWVVHNTGWFSGGAWSELRVVDRAGLRPSWRRLLLRQLVLALWCALDVCLLLPSVLLGPFIVAATKNRVGIYDAIAGTRLQDPNEPSITSPAQLSSHKTAAPA